MPTFSQTTRRGRCPHRPGKWNRFYGNLRRIRWYPWVDVGIDPYETEIVQGAAHRKDKVFRVSVISSGDPLEIYTEKDGEVILKKYSPMGDLGEFAGQICEAIGKNTGYIAAVCDRDAIIAVHGVQKRELLDKRCS